MVKVFTPNKNGKIEFTKEELEALLNEVWQDGYSQNRQYWWISPMLTVSDKTVPYTPTVTCEGALGSDSITCHGEPHKVTLANANTTEVKVD